MTNAGIRRTVYVLLGLLIFGVLAVTGTRYQRDIRAARERVSAGSRIAQTPCGPIEYAETSGGPPVLVVHGSGEIGRAHV